jgi:hypothetical protein
VISATIRCQPSLFVVGRRHRLVIRQRISGIVVITTTGWDVSSYGLADGSAEPETVGAALPLGRTDGLGIGVGSVKRLLGKPANASAKISTKMANTTMTHGRASMSSRGGSAPR